MKTHRFVATLTWLVIVTAWRPVADAAQPPEIASHIPRDALVAWFVSNPAEAVTNLEALFAFDWANFSYDFPKTDIEIKAILILGLTDWGRYRVDLDARFDRELFSDFHFVVKGFYNFDSNPPTEGASREDYQISLALGYKF